MLNKLFSKKMTPGEASQKVKSLLGKLDANDIDIDALLSTIPLASYEMSEVSVIDGRSYRDMQTVEHTGVTFKEAATAALRQAAGLHINGCFLFSFGDLMGYIGTGNLTPQSTPFILNSDEVLVASPSVQLLPTLCRAPLSQRLKEKHGITNPAIALLINGPQNFVFNKFQESFLDDASQQAFCEDMGWYIPKHVMIALVSETMLSPDNFERL